MKKKSSSLSTDRCLPAKRPFVPANLFLFLALAFTAIPAFSQSKAPALPANLPHSEAIEAGEVLYISGHIGYDPATDTLVTTSFRAEVRQAMDNIGKVLRQHDLSYNELVSVTVYLTDMSRYAEMNEIYGQYFKSTYPARVCIAVRQLPLNANIEISATAYLPWRRNFPL